MILNCVNYQLWITEQNDVYSRKTWANNNFRMIVKGKNNESIQNSIKLFSITQKIKCYFQSMLKSWNLADQEKSYLVQE